MLPTRPQRAEIHRRMQAAAEHLRLPFRSRVWRGQAGNWLGAGVGSSIDFQDHRPYVPGDDPRYIDWQAYGRSGQYTMKLYREEVSPLVDLVFDSSASMFFESSKAIRALELFYFCVESARQAGSLRCFATAGEELVPLSLDHAIAGEEFLNVTSSRLPNMKRVPWRQGSLRVLISDLLFPGSPEATLSHLSAGRGRGIIFAPFCESESKPSWSGNTLFRDCETLRQRNQRVEPDLLSRYNRAYRRHFALWRERARKHAVIIARVGSGTHFREAVQGEALSVGSIELC